MSTRVVTAPNSYAVTIADVQAHLRLALPEESGYVTGLIQQAQRWCEEYTGRRFTTVTLESVFMLPAVPSGPVSGPISSPQTGLNYGLIFGIPVELPYAPIQSVTTVWLETTPTVWAQTTGYVVDTYAVPGTVIFTDNLFISGTGRVRVQYVAGHGSADPLPDGLKHAVLRMTANLYTARGGGTVDLAGVQSLLDPYRILSLR